MSTGERKILLKMLPRQSQYFRDLHAQGRPSLIAKIYGIYRVKLDGLSAINLMVMKNSIMKVHHSSQILHKFDLKGSKVKRRVLPEAIQHAQG